VQSGADGDAADALRTVPGVRNVTVADRYGALTGYEVEAETSQDIRREVARTVVGRGWGLLELRPMRMSLEEIFLQLTTEEQPEEAAHE
jgi:ABC-2 type transport system ATP-binding protein